MTRRQRFVRWLTGTTVSTPVAVIEPDDRPVPKGMTVSYAALWESQRSGQPVPIVEDLFARPVPPRGVLPAGMAMDNLPALANLAAFGLQSMYHEGLAFPGYGYLAELAQRPEYRHMAEIWAEHATRKWIKLTGPDDKRLGVIEAELERLNVRAVFREADEIDGKFGRSHIYLDFGDGERRQRLLVDPRKVTPDRKLQAIRAVEPMWVYPGMYETRNPLDADFYRPRFWYVQGDTVADSRMLTFVRHPVPDMLKPSYAFGGQSYTQLAKPYVDNWLRTRQSVSDVTSAFSQMVLATDMGSTLTGGTGEDLYTRVDMFNRTRDNRGTMVINKDSEELTNVTTPLSGLDALQAQAQEQLSSVARIPLSIYLQVTPTGLNASSDGEIRSFYADVTAHQEKDYRPNLQRIIELVQLGIDGKIDPDVKFTFEPLWEMSATEIATVRKTEAETDQIYVTAGAVSNEEVRERLREQDGGLYQSVGLEGDAPEVDDDDVDTTDNSDKGKA
jgi:phage-related protein (TIGR01555 family)